METELFDWRSKPGIYGMILLDFKHFFNMKSTIMRWIWLLSFPVVNSVVVSVVNFFQSQNKEYLNTINFHV